MTFCASDKGQVGEEDIRLPHDPCRLHTPFLPSRILKLLISWHWLAELTEVRPKFGCLLASYFGELESPSIECRKRKEEVNIMMSRLERHSQGARIRIMSNQPLVTPDATAIIV